MKFSIKNRFTGKIITEVELDASYESKSCSVQLGAAVEIAVAKNTNLTGADLAGADLSCVDLAYANLSGANLANANLSGANLANANLAYADLTGADLTCADLTGAYLAGAYLAGVVRGKKGILQINGQRWPVLITPECMKIGCEKHSHGDWRSFDDRRIAEMDGKEALKFWRDNKDWLLERCEWAAGFKKDGV